MRHRQDLGTRIATWRHPALRRLSFLLLMPFLCLSLLEAGIMPVRDAAGHVNMVLCGSDAPVAMVVAPDGTVAPAGGNHGEGSHTACVWAAHGQAMDDAGSAPLPQAGAAFHRQDPAAEPITAPHLVATNPNLARGPPAAV